MGLIYVWLIIFIVTILIEIATASTLVSIWFSLGSLFAMLVSLVIDSFMIQFVVFIIISIISLAMLRPLLKSKLIAQNISTNADRLIGQNFKVLSNSSDTVLATVKANGIIWNVKPVDNISLQIDDMVNVISIEGSKLIVKKI